MAKEQQSRGEDHWGYLRYGHVRAAMTRYFTSKPIDTDGWKGIEEAHVGIGCVGLGCAPSTNKQQPPPEDRAVEPEGGGG